MTQLIKAQVYSQMPPIERIAARSALAIVIKWGTHPVKWNTHKAINQRRGEWKSHVWNDEL